MRCCCCQHPLRQRNLQFNWNVFRNSEICSGVLEFVQTVHIPAKSAHMIALVWVVHQTGKNYSTLDQI